LVALELQLLLQVFELTHDMAEHNISSIIERLCHCSLQDDEIGIAECSRRLYELVGKGSQSVH